MAEEISKQIGRCIRIHRNNQRLTQEFLAEQAELTTNYLGQIERGEKNPTIHMLKKITVALGMPLSDLVLQAEDLDQHTSASTQHLRAYAFLRKFTPETVELMQRFLESIGKV